GGAVGGGPGHEPGDSAGAASGTTGSTATASPAGWGTALRILRHGISAPNGKPTATAAKATAITRRESGEGESLATRPTSGPAVVWVAEENSPPVFDRFIETPEPDVTPDGDSLEGAVRNLKASFSVLKGTVIRAPESSPSVTIEILAPGYCFCSLAFAAAMSD